jgi:predicted enzyme related to lactoylglutathione lyase
MLFQRVDRVVWNRANEEDFKKTLEFFSDLLDVKFDIIRDPEAQVMVALSRGGFGLELGMPFHHEDRQCMMIIKVTNMDEAVQKFKEHGIEVRALRSVGEAKEASFDPKDTCGIPIILNECPEPHMMYTEVTKYFQNKSKD